MRRAACAGMSPGGAASFREGCGTGRGHSMPRASTPRGGCSTGRAAERASTGAGAGETRAAAVEEGEGGDASGEGGGGGGWSREGDELSPPPKSVPSGHWWSKLRLSAGVSASTAFEQKPQVAAHSSCMSATSAC